MADSLKDHENRAFLDNSQKYEIMKHNMMSNNVKIPHIYRPEGD